LHGTLQTLCVMKSGKLLHQYLKCLAVLCTYNPHLSHKDILYRTNDGLEGMLHICACQDEGLWLAVGEALEQVMVSMN